MHNKQRGLLSRGVLLLHGNMCSHSAATTVEEIRNTPYSPDLAPLDYQMFGPLEALYGQRLATDDEI